jgi:hypothetical protein
MKKNLTVEEFDALPKNEKAVLVAKDVLKQIKLKKYIPKVGSYIKRSDDYSLKALGLKKKDDVKNNFDKIPPCRVCVLGSMLLSCTNLGNRLTFSDVDIINGDRIDNLNKPKIKKLFNSIFDAYQLLLIENAFEKPSEIADRYAKNILGLKLSEEDFDKCENFYYKYNNNNNNNNNTGYNYDYPAASERMVAICENIIKNKGTFVL